MRFPSLSLPTQGEVWTRALACGRDGRLAAAWVEESAGQSRVRVALRLPRRPMRPALTLARTPDSEEGADFSDATVAFAPDGELLIVWAQNRRIRAATLSRTGVRGRTVTVGKASGGSQVAAEYGANGRAVAAWSTRTSARSATRRGSCAPRCARRTARSSPRRPSTRAE